MKTFGELHEKYNIGDRVSVDHKWGTATGTIVPGGMKKKGVLHQNVKYDKAHGTIGSHKVSQIKKIEEE